MISKFIRVINMFSYGHNDPILKIPQRYYFFLIYANKWTIFLKFYEKDGISLQKRGFFEDDYLVFFKTIIINSDIVRTSERSE